MANYITRRLLHLIPVLVGVSLAVFLLLKLTPGDPATAILGIQATPTEVARIRHAMGLDRPWLVQYSIWLVNVLRGDLGVSYQNKQPVALLIRQRLPATVELAMTSLLIAVVFGISTGILSALRRYTLADYLCTSLALFGISMPSFWFAIMLILIFALYLGWFPASGYAPWSEGLGTHLKHLALPSIALGLFNTGALMRFTRSSMLEVISQDYVRTARAKGLMERVVIYRHALKNALIPTLTVLGLQVGFLLAGAVIIEQVFAWPGIGWLTLTAINQRDYPVVMGVVLIIALVFVLSNLVVDILYTWVDPRIRYDAGNR
jgi:peptide/nickel transport system permease protein